MMPAIPEYRRAIAGRTWPQRWQPIPIEHHVRPRGERRMYLGLVVFLAVILFGLPMLAHLIARWSA